MAVTSASLKNIFNNSGENSTGCVLIKELAYIKNININR